MTPGERIKKLRQNAGLSQEKLAEMVGVSRQAVTKWEAGQSAPGTENLFRLAEIFGTTVDMLIRREKPDAQTLAAAKAQKTKINLLWTLAAAAVYLLIYIIGRFFADGGERTSIIGWLTDNSPACLSYLYGWLLHNRLFWASMAVSVLAAAAGKIYFSAFSAAGFSVGLVLGELAGANPAGAAYGFGHYGWLIWAGIFILGMSLGAAGQLLAKKRGRTALKYPAIAFVLLSAAIVLAVRISIPLV